MTHTGTNPMRLTTRIPDETRPKMVCFPSRKGVGARVTKNCEPFVSLPLLAIDNIPAPVCLSSLVISSLNVGLLKIERLVGILRSQHIYQRNNTHI